MRHLTLKLSAYLFMGLLLNVFVTIALTVVDWRPQTSSYHHHPRSQGAQVFCAARELGAEWVEGFTRSGTLLDTDPGSVYVYSEMPWWPPEALTTDGASCATAAGWPLLSFCSWRISSAEAGISAPSVVFTETQHWGLVLAERSKVGGDAFPVVLPYRPIVTGFVVNTSAYAAVSLLAVNAAQRVRRRVRCSRGLCVRCAYPVPSHSRCPECGCPASSLPSPRGSAAQSARGGV